jgi:hypothetical protein
MGQLPEIGPSVTDLDGGRSPGGGGAAGGRRAESGCGEQAKVHLASRGNAAPNAAVSAFCTSTLAGAAVLVLAAHAGAGASTVALLLSEAVALDGTHTRLVECADPTRSGVAAATDAELGEDPSGWRCGRRGPLEVDRPSRHLPGAEEVAAPRSASADAAGASVTVVDAGWPAWDIIAGTGWVTGLLSIAQIVLVCRATVPGVRQIEQLLAALPGQQPLIAAVGPSKWPGVVSAGCGPLLRAARADDRIVPVPLDRQLAVTGLTAGPLPRQLTVAGRSLAGHIQTGPPGTDHPPRPPGWLTPEGRNFS